jgi:hypothetical protein
MAIAYRKKGRQKIGLFFRASFGTDPILFYSKFSPFLGVDGFGEADLSRGFFDGWLLR